MGHIKNAPNKYENPPKKYKNTLKSGDFEFFRGIFR